MHSCESCGRETRARTLCPRCNGFYGREGDGRREIVPKGTSLEDIEFAAANDDDGWPYSDRDRVE